MTYIVGRKGVSYYNFRNLPVAKSWTGFSDQPTYGDAKAVVGRPHRGLHDRDR